MIIIIVMFYAARACIWKKSSIMLFTIKTLHNFCIYRYLELKHYPTFAFIVIYN